MVFGISLLLKYEKGTTTLYRLTLLSDPYHNPSSGIRISFLKSSLETWQKNPILGMGIGSWPVIMKYGDMRGYPHNIIIEVLLELGLVGLIFFLIFIGYALKTFFRRNVLRNPISLFVFLIFLTTFLEAMVSGDMTDHRFLYVSLGLMTLSTTPDRLAAPMPQKYMTGLWGYNKSQIKKHLLFPAKI
jgi:O-antigen ligase